MAIVNDKSKKIRPVWAIIVSVILLPVACAVLRSVVVGLETGEIWRLSKYHKGLVTKAESPESYWFSVVGSSVIALLLGWIVVWSLKEAFRGSRK
jgi:hypothetical protein